MEERTGGWKDDPLLDTFYLSVELRNKTRQTGLLPATTVNETGIITQSHTNSVLFIQSLAHDLH